MKTRFFLGMSTMIALLASCSEKEEGRSKLIVKTEKAVTYSNDTDMEFSFISRPYRTSELSFRVGGPIDRFEVYTGNYYQRGSIIAEIDPRDFHIHKEHTEAIYQQMKAEYERTEKLYKKNNISASQYEKTKADYAAAKSAFEIASNELSDTRLLAPFNGYVSEVYIEKFQDVKATQPVLSLIDITQLRIEAYVTQEVAASIDAIDSIEVRFDMYPDKPYKAKVMEVSKGTTRNNLSYLLTALLPNSDNKLLAGMSGKITIDAITPQKETGIIIPQSALCHRPTEGDFVWVVDENAKVHLRKVKKGTLLPHGKIFIAEGLSPNETIATSGLRFLSDGMKVEQSSKKN